jgi:hypothetical protein
MAFGVTRDPLSGAIRANNAASGANLYGANGSHTATQGAVDGTGYEQRELQRKARRRAINRRMQISSQPALSTPLGGQQY